MNDNWCLSYQLLVLTRQPANGRRLTLLYIGCRQMQLIIYLKQTERQNIQMYVRMYKRRYFVTIFCLYTVQNNSESQIIYYLRIGHVYHRTS